MARIIHVCLSVRGALSLNRREFARQFRNVVKDENGRTLSPDEFRNRLMDELSKGREVLPIGECDNFDWKQGCRGHKESEAA
ncbi:MAG TPA: hypothetical protein VNQ79_05285 [Blastocatellia bacterium]|nr:hypothetical protein [Blastocatellia bacterium]